MKTPFDTLGINEDATDEDIKHAYLQKVKRYPPEQAPEQFQLIRGAYEAIKTEQQRIKYYLFHLALPEMIEIVEPHLTQKATRCPTEDLLMKTLASMLTLPDYR